MRARWRLPPQQGLPAPPSLRGPWGRGPANAARPRTKRDHVGQEGQPAPAATTPPRAPPGAVERAAAALAASLPAGRARRAGQVRGPVRRGTHMCCRRAPLAGGRGRPRLPWPACRQRQRQRSGAPCPPCPPPRLRRWQQGRQRALPPARLRWGPPWSAHAAAMHWPGNRCWMLLRLWASTDALSLPAPRAPPEYGPCPRSARHLAISGVAKQNSGQSAPLGGRPEERLARKRPSHRSCGHAVAKARGSGPQCVCGGQPPQEVTAPAQRKDGRRQVRSLTAAQPGARALRWLRRSGCRTRNSVAQRSVAATATVVLQLQPERLPPSGLAPTSGLPCAGSAPARRFGA